LGNTDVSASGERSPDSPRRSAERAMAGREQQRAKILGGESRPSSRSSEMAAVRGVQLEGAFTWTMRSRDRSILAVSAGSRQLSGQPAERWLQEPDLLLEITHPSDRGSVLQALTSARQELHGARITHRVQLPDGASRWWLTTVTPALEGEEPVLNGLSVDVSDFMEEVERWRGAAEKGETVAQESEHLLSMVAHDLGNPLGSVLLAVRVLRAFTSPRRPGYWHLLLIQRCIERMRGLVSDLLDVPSVRGGALSVHREEGELASVLEEVAEEVRLAAEDKSLTLEIDIPDLPDVACDRRRIAQVVSNLLGNAIKFTPRGGRVRLEATANEREIVVSVIDGGRGIAPSELDAIFERYWQSPDTASMGHGLGLFISRGIVSAHGGRIWVESTEGAGSTFRFTLPLPAHVEP
jgi:signal transduction histidine kinase